MGNSFSRDGSVTRVLEKVPIVGYGVAGVQALAGNPEHAKRALATSTNGLLTTAGAVGGMLVGGPVGAVAGGAAASQLGMVTEYAISTTITDKDVKGNVGEISLNRAVTDAVLGGASGLIGGGAGATAAGKAAGSVVLDTTVKTLTKTGFEKTAVIIAQNVGKNAAGAITTGGLASLAQGASKGIFESKPDTKDPEPKKPKTRIVTQKQQDEATRVTGECEKFIADYPLHSLIDAYRSVHLYWEAFVIHGLPWEPANQCVQMQWDALQNKKLDHPGQPPLFQRVRDELLEIVALQNNPAQLSANQAKVLQKMQAAGNANALQGEIEQVSLILEFQLRLFKDLMVSDIEEV